MGRNRVLIAVKVTAAVIACARHVAVASWPHTFYVGG